MTDEEVKILLTEWAATKGDYFTEEELASLIAVLEEHFLSPETTTLEQARGVLGLVQNRKEVEP